MSIPLMLEAVGKSFTVFTAGAEVEVVAVVMEELYHTHKSKSWQYGYSKFANRALYDKLLRTEFGHREPVMLYTEKTNRPLPAPIPISGIFVLESHHGHAFQMQPTSYPFFKIMYVLDGEGNVSWNKTSLRIRKSDVIAVPADFEHRLEDHPQHALSLIVLCVQNHVLKLAGPESLKFPSCRVLRNNALSFEARRVLRQMLFEQSLAQAHAATMLTGLTLQFLTSAFRLQMPHTKTAEIYAVQTAPEMRVRAYISELDKKFCENEKIDNVVARLGISRRYFTQLFRKITGKSWLSYLRQLRLNHARALLRNTDRSILLIAFESGFDDLSSFYRAFKTAQKISPMKYRDQRTA